MMRMDLPSLATEYTLTPTGTDIDTRNIISFCVRVQRRGPDLWALLSHGRIWNGTDWQYDYPEHEQDADFARQCLRDLRTALEVGAGLPDTVLVAGTTWSQWQERKSPSPAPGQPRERPAATIFDLAAAVLARTGETTTMTLHKLAYYCQAWHLVWEDRLLADADFYAWGTGPVNPDLHEFHRGTFKISQVPGSPDVFTKDENESIDEVVKVYGKLRAFELSGIVKNEDPWKSAWAGTEPGQRGRLIDADRMQSFYIELDGEPVGGQESAAAV